MQLVFEDKEEQLVFDLQELAGKGRPSRKALFQKSGPLHVLTEVLESQETVASPCHSDEGGSPVRVDWVEFIFEHMFPYIFKHAVGTCVGEHVSAGGIAILAPSKAIGNHQRGTGLARRT